LTEVYTVKIVHVLLTITAETGTRLHGVFETRPDANTYARLHNLNGGHARPKVFWTEKMCQREILADVHTVERHGEDL